MILEDLINLCFVCFLNNVKFVIYFIGIIYLLERNYFQIDNKFIILICQNLCFIIERVIQFYGYCLECDIEWCLVLYDVIYDMKKKIYNGFFVLELVDVCRRNWCFLFLIFQIYNIFNKIGLLDYLD